METLKETQSGPNVPPVDPSLPYKVADLSLADWGRKEMDLAEKRYLKRKLDAKTYQALVQKNQETLIQLEAQIKHLYSEANIQKVMDSLKERLSDLEGEKRDNKKKKEKGIRAEELQIASDIADQLSKR